MNIQTGGKVSGVYGIKVLRNAGTDKEHLEDFGESPNMLLDGFFERFASGDLAATGWYMFVGSGTTPAEATQTQLVSQVGNYVSMSVGVNDNAKVGNDYIASSTGVAEWAIGAIVGNISEVGIRLGARIGSTLDSRALIVDSQGAPTTITVTAEDKLVVSYTLKYIIPIQPHASVVDIGSVSTTCTTEMLEVLIKETSGVEAAFATFKYGAVGTSSSQEIINNPEALLVGVNPNSAAVNYTVMAANKKRTSFFLGVNNGNEAGGIKYVGLPGNFRSNRYFMGVHFDPPIPKDNTKTLTLNFDFTLTRA